MPDYQVKISKATTEVAVIEVYAKNEDEAHDKAMKRAQEGLIDWELDDENHEVNEVIELTEPEDEEDDLEVELEDEDEDELL